jgi:subtilisin family serine protease
VVAVIDGGIDTAHVELRPVLWRNPKEQPGTQDTDGNGYPGDVRGWNFIGGADGRNVEHDTFELTRLYAACRATGTTSANGPMGPPANGAAACDAIVAAYSVKSMEITQTLAQIENIGRALDGAVRVLSPAITGELTAERVQAFQPAGAQQTQARQMFLQLAANGLTPEVLAEARKAYGSQATYGLDTAYNPRPLVGDDYANGTERTYGNADIMGPDATHGTHVAGIIAAVRGNGVGLDGITDGVQIMGVRTVPDGDERDKDVANAIRYAVDNGAQIINMSFGKSYSPREALVEDAIRYADSKGVLLVHAAGNDAQNNDEERNYPNSDLGGQRAKLWIEVGASSWKGGEELPAAFSNYGQTQVDLFAPGVGIYSTMPGGTYKRQDGTSMAAPVVSGVAALLMAYYPELSAADVREILMASVTKLPDVRVVPPGAPPEVKVPFGTLSVSGGIINAYEAVKLAESRRKGLRP